MTGSKDHRSLVALSQTASTARVLNLALKHAELRERLSSDQMLFHAVALSRSIIVKHRVREHERSYFDTAPIVATKLMVPVDPANMSYGAFSVLIGQRHCDEILSRDLLLDRAPDGGARDRAVLRSLDALPSLDPFLVREHLRRQGITASDEYFEISPSDSQKMEEFVEDSLAPLITLSLGGVANSKQTRRLAQKILASDLDASMEPFRATLRMSREEFIEGAFSWKGFLYYKWALSNISAQANGVSRAVRSVKILGKASSEEKRYLLEARTRVQAAILLACRNVGSTLRTYDDAFQALTMHANPTAFRSFLLNAPRLFMEVGEKLGAVQHITSAWQFRFADGKAARGLPAPEWVDLFLDFENSLGLTPEPGRDSVGAPEWKCG